MVSAFWKNTAIATSDETVDVNGSHHFPPSAVDQSLFEVCEHSSICPLKGLRGFFMSTMPAGRAKSSFRMPAFLPTSGLVGCWILSSALCAVRGQLPRIPARLRDQFLRSEMEHAEFAAAFEK